MQKYVRRVLQLHIATIAQMLLLLCVALLRRGAEKKTKMYLMEFASL